MPTQTSEIQTLVDVMLIKSASLSEEGKRELAKKWKSAAAGHRKNASYYEKQGQFTKKKQEQALSECYDRVADSLRNICDES